MVDPHVPVERRFIPTLKAVKDAWMAHFVVHANVPEKIERELGFEVMMDRLRAQYRAEAFAEAASIVRFAPGLMVAADRIDALKGT